MNNKDFLKGVDLCKLNDDQFLGSYPASEVMRACRDNEDKASGSPKVLKMVHDIYHYAELAQREQKDSMVLVRYCDRDGNLVFNVIHVYPDEWDK